MAIMTTSSGAGPSGLLRNYWQRQLLKILENNCIAADLVERQTIPANSGKVIEFRRITAFSKQMTGSSEFLGWMTYGDLKGSSFTVDSVVSTLELVTNDLQLSELAIITSEPNPMPTLSSRFLYNAKDSLDQRIINIMVSNTGNTQSSTAPSVNYFGSSVSTGTVWGDGSQTLTEATLDADIPSHRIAAETFNTAYTNLRKQSAPLRNGRYDALLAPEICGDLRTDGTFQDIALKGTARGGDKFEQAMVGDVFGIRALEDENVGIPVAGTIDATNDEIFRCPVVAPGYAARINHAKGVGTPRVNYIPPSKADKADPHGLVGILTWKMYVADSGVINPYCGQLIKVATTRTKATDSYDDSTWNLSR